MATGFQSLSKQKKRTSVKTDTRLKAQSKCGEIFSNFFPQNFGSLFPQRNGILRQNIAVFLIFPILAKFRPKKTLFGPHTVYLVIILPPTFTWGLTSVVCLFVIHTSLPCHSFHKASYLSPKGKKLALDRQPTQGFFLIKKFNDFKLKRKLGQTDHLCEGGGLAIIHKTTKTKFGQKSEKKVELFPNAIIYIGHMQELCDLNIL